jgi:hypothetical protein
MPELGTLRQATVVCTAAHPDTTGQQIRLDLSGTGTLLGTRPGVTAPFDQLKRRKMIALSDCKMPDWTIRE